MPTPYGPQGRPCSPPAYRRPSLLPWKATLNAWNSSRIRLITVAATAMLLVGCSSTPAEELEDWWSSGGQARIKALTDAANKVNEVSTDPMEFWGPACQNLLTEAKEAKKLDTIPSVNAKDFWTKALDAFDDGGNECVAGTSKKDLSQAGEGVREIQEGISLLSSTVKMIKIDLDARTS